MIGAAGALLACRSHAPRPCDAAAAARPAATPHREAARRLLEENCGGCHRADQPTAQARALAVFTLNEIDFAARMSEEQLRDVVVRVGDNGLERRDVEVMEAFVGEELARRSDAGAASHDAPQGGRD
jgi:hypothetical protein